MEEEGRIGFAPILLGRIGFAPILLSRLLGVSARVKRKALPMNHSAFSVSKTSVVTEDMNVLHIEYVFLTEIKRHLTVSS